MTTSSFLLFTDKGMLCEKVTQSSPDKIVESGSEVTLPCTYDSEYSDPDLYWYRIRPDRSFQFILYRDGTRALDVDFTQGRFSVQHSQTHETFNLVISSVRTEDRATYYCGICTHGDAGAQEVCTQTPGRGLVEQLVSLDMAAFFLVMLCSTWPSEVP